MPTNTYVALAAQTLGSTSSSVTFSSLPSSYTDLVLVVQTTSGGEVLVRFNSDTGTNYSATEIWGPNGSSAVSQRESNISYITLRDSNTTLGNNMSVVNIMNYSNTTTYKTVLVRSNDGRYSRVYARVGLWRNTAAINGITLLPSSGTFAAGSSFSIYGIKAQVAPGTAKATGGTITYDAYGNVIHTFTGNGTFTPSVNLTCEYLVVGGGGGAQIGGGGAGGLLNSTSSFALGTNYTVTIGAGGAGQSGGSTDNGTNGVNSSFSTFTAIGGGKGGGVLGSNETQNGGNGGSGGGGGNSGGTATSGQGFAGGNSPSSGAGAGGGGAGSAGVDHTVTNTGSAGGSGVNLTITGSSVNYCAGGGAGGSGSGGAAGGASAGNGVASGTPGSGAVNAGGGGGGNWFTNTGGAGGSGVVIIRYSGV